MGCKRDCVSESHDSQRFTLLRRTCRAYFGLGTHPDQRIVNLDKLFPWNCQPLMSITAARCFVPTAQDGIPSLRTAVIWTRPSTTASISRRCSNVGLHESFKEARRPYCVFKMLNQRHARHEPASLIETGRREIESEYVDKTNTEVDGGCRC